MTLELRRGAAASIDGQGPSREPGEDEGTYAILQGTLALTTNYALTYVGADFTITAVGGEPPAG